MDVQAGPNWDDDLGGSIDYARQDPNVLKLSSAEQEAMFQLERMTLHYLPRICNHCLNPACVASCPSGALYKRGEDGIVLINQERCRAWRMCVTACPYKKSYYNWSTGKSEKCVLCYPHLYPIQDDEQFVLELLRAEKLLLVQGSAFNWPYSDHLRWVLLLRSDE